MLRTLAQVFARPASIDATLAAAHRLAGRAGCSGRASLQALSDYRLETMLLAPMGGGAMIGAHGLGHGPCPVRRTA